MFRATGITAYLASYRCPVRRRPRASLPKALEPWSPTTMREKLITIGAKIVSHGRYFMFQMAEVAVSRQMFTDLR